MLRARIYSGCQEQVVGIDRINGILLTFSYDIVDAAYGSMAHYPKRHKEAFLPELAKLTGNIERTSNNLTGNELKFLNGLRGLYWDMDDSKWEEHTDLSDPKTDRFIAENIGRYISNLTNLLDGLVEYPKNKKSLTPTEYLKKACTRTMR